MLNVGAKVELSNREILECARLAKSRHAVNRTNRVADQKVGAQDAFQTDFEGMCGEAAFCKLIGVEADTTLHPRSVTGKSDTGDASLGSTIVDVKTTRYPTGKLLARTNKTPNGTLFVLMVGSNGKYVFAGCMDDTELLTEDHITDLGYGATFAANQSELKAAKVTGKDILAV